tara:strand:+ start:973 stop:1311 length:339 start_codon:yes stop_codon:yes gene_type:complete
MYCQLEIEGGVECSSQCDHCNEYYKPLEESKKYNKVKTAVIQLFIKSMPFFSDNQGVAEVDNELKNNKYTKSEYSQFIGVKRSLLDTINSDSIGGEYVCRVIKELDIEDIFT